MSCRVMHGVLVLIIHAFSDQEAYAMIQAGKALLCDIRTSAEVHWSGYIPGSQVTTRRRAYHPSFIFICRTFPFVFLTLLQQFVQWKLFDGTAALKENPAFKQQLTSACPDKTIPLLMMCRRATTSPPSCQSVSAQT